MANSAILVIIGVPAEHIILNILVYIPKDSANKKVFTKFENNSVYRPP